MGALLGLAAAAGLLLILLGLTDPRAPGSTAAGRSGRLAHLITASGLARVTPAGVVGACLAAGTLGGMAALTVTSVPVVALVAIPLCAYAPVMALRRKAARREAALRAAWPDAVDVLVSAVRAGMSLGEAVADLSRRGPEPLRPAFAAFAADYHATGSLPLSLDLLKDRLADPVADRVVAALGLAREVGGQELGRVLRTLAEFLRDDSRMRGEIEGRQSWTVNAARMAVAAPWITLALLSTRPEAAAAYSTTGGAVVLAIAAVLSVAAYRTMLAIGRLPADERVLR